MLTLYRTWFQVAEALTLNIVVIEVYCMFRGRTLR